MALPATSSPITVHVKKALGRWDWRGAYNRLSFPAKVMVAILVPMAIALSVLVLLLFFSHYALLQQQTLQSCLLTATLTADHVGAALLSGTSSQAEAALNVLAQNPSVLGAAVYAPTGQRLARYFRHGEIFDLPDFDPRGVVNEWRGNRLIIQHPIYALDRPLGTLQMVVDVSPLRRQLLLLLLLFVFVVVLYFLVGYAVATKVRHVLARPIEHLSFLARTVRDTRDYSMRAVKTSEDEVGVLAEEFNQMLSEIEARTRELEEMRNTLEETVRQRTQQLERESLEHKRTAEKLQREIAERRKVEEDLKGAIETAEAASRFKGEFLANMSHEIRTPMNGVIAMADLLLNTALSPIQRKYGETIQRSARALLKIINDILDYSKIESGHIEIESEPIDFQVVCEDVIEVLSPRAEEKGIALILRYAPDMPRRLVGDGGRLRQVLTNLVGNAIKFTHKGHVFVNVECTGRTESSAAFRVSVEDTGIGVPQEKIDILFAKYSQSHRFDPQLYGGTGLGLAISKQLVEKMGGTIGVHTREGVGSCFYFALVLPTDESIRAPRRDDLQGVRVLVVDHSPVNRRVLLEQLQSWGMHADAVGSSADALHALRKAAQDGNPYRIALLDDQMPGIRGESLGRVIKSEADLQETLLVLLTSFGGQRGDAERVKELGFSAYLTRPIRQSELMDALITLWKAHLRGESIGLVTRYTVAESKGRVLRRAPVPKFAARILVAEDNYVNQQVALEILGMYGCTVTIARDGAEAVEEFKRASFDLVFMDCQMPNKDGYEATREIRTYEGNRSHVPIIAMTAHAMKGDREQCLSAGMDDYVSKPVDPNSVLDVLRRWLGRAEEPIEPPRRSSSPASVTFQVEDLPTLDLKQALHNIGGKMTTFRRLAQVFMQHIPSRMYELAQAVEKMDVPEIARLAHAIQGAAGSVGATRFHALSRELEKEARGGRVEDAPRKLQELQREFGQLKQALETIEAQDNAAEDAAQESA